MSDDTVWRRGLRFFTETLWEVEPEEYQGFRRRGVKYLQILALVVRGFRADQCMLRATALAFTTMLSLVPFFALAFAVLKGLGVHNRLEPLILEKVAAGSQEVVDRIVTYIDNTNMASMGAVGLAALIMTVISLFGNIEETFNAIWGVKETRSFYRKFSDYLSVAVSGPLLLFAAMSITTTLSSQSFVKWIIARTYLGNMLLFGFQLVPYVSIWLALVFLYTFIPNTKVHVKSALIGGILAGTSWQVAQWGYINFQVGVAKYNAIYGTLALLPILMVWIYTSWLIVLFGVEVVYAHQNIRTFHREERGVSLNQGLREFLALAVLRHIAVAFHRGHPPWSAERLAAELDVPLRIIRELLIELVTTGYLIEIAGEELTCLPARELERIPVSDVVETLRNYGGGSRISRVVRKDASLRELIARIDTGAATALAGMTLKDLADMPVGKESPLQGGNG